MAKIKLTKTELKAQQDDLKRYQRFLPTLQLKKQQLLLEMRSSAVRLRENEDEEAALRKQLAGWVAIFGDERLLETVPSLLSIVEIDKGTANIAGVTVPVFRKVEFETKPYDLFAADFYLDAVLEAVRQVISVQEAHRVLEEQYRLLAAELATTTQRVNLFEKVKIPECKENIRKIRIYMGDQDTAAVARSKIAKRKSQETAA
ncbi:V-type ATP synthase subunit D [Victivallis sp. Marseille-Q1083]|uniref:V-type ATP synthase subunit D n=1 Tax=Victivallis sp. Marseille-Q1083 TaxID=2717288 RepID=UPI00158D7E2B|nr:V-type ATP synthase subunit D [Victivallis sp. Marseille-Q1083]